jgi:signal transduction histidine kinase
MLLFSCVRELVFNVVKHSGAQHAVVALQWLDASLRIEVHDHCKGFSLHTPEEKQVHWELP